MSTRVYIGRIDPGTSERDVEKFFRGYGKIEEVMLKTGFAFVEFTDPRDADDACHDLSGKEFNGYRVMVDIARGTPHGRDWVRDRDKGYYGGVGWQGAGGPGGGGGGRSRLRYERSDHRLIVENLSSRVSWQELKDTFRDEGIEALYCTAHTTQKNEASRSESRSSGSRSRSRSYSRSRSPSPKKERKRKSSGKKRYSQSPASPEKRRRSSGEKNGRA